VLLVDSSTLPSQALISWDKVSSVELAARLVGEALKPAARWGVAHLYHIIIGGWLYHIMMITLLMIIMNMIE